MTERNSENDIDMILERQIDPLERAYFIEKTGIVIRWMLILAGTIIQLIEPVIPMQYFYIALPVAIVYNLGVRFLLEKKKVSVNTISLFTAIMDNLVSIALIYFATTTDIYLWYFVLLVSHAARFGFKGAVISPFVFSSLYISGLLLRGFSLPISTIIIRVSFFVITGIVSGYLAREEHRRFDSILKQQKDIFVTQQKRKEMREMLQRYLSFNLVEELLKNPSKIRLGGSRQKVSVLFSDISGFTGLLSNVEPEKVIGVLNEYLTEMTNIIFSFGGMVDKFVGDAVIGIFGAPNPSENDTICAVRAALSMQEKLKVLQTTWRESISEIIQARVAVTTGEVILGNIGSPQRMDYTAIGDTVNIASRLQAIAELGHVVISKSTLSEIQDQIDVKELGKVELKGKTEPIDVYQVLSFKGEDCNR